LSESGIGGLLDQSSRFHFQVQRGFRRELSQPGADVGGPAWDCVAGDDEEVSRVESRASRVRRNSSTKRKAVATGV